MSHLKKNLNEWTTIPQMKSRNSSKNYSLSFCNQGKAASNDKVNWEGTNQHRTTGFVRQQYQGLHRKPKYPTSSTSQVPAQEQEIKTPESGKEGSHLQSLPIYNTLPTILRELEEEKMPVLILECPTASGKTAGFSQFYGLESKTNKQLWISIPTIINVWSQYDYAVGKLPSYESRFGFSGGGQRSPNLKDAKVIYATTQTVINQLSRMYRESRSELNNVVVMIDESHHPSVENFLLMAMCNWLLRKKCQIQIIVSTATPQPIHEVFSHIKGKTHSFSNRKHQIVTHWGKYNLPSYSIDQAFKTTYYAMILENTHRAVQDHGGDVLVFASGEETIEYLCGELRKNYPEFDICPAYSALPSEELQLVYQVSKHRKIIVASNIAESGITIPNISSVVDGLLHKTKRVSKGVQTMVESLISKASAKQRAGRCGRDRKGHYYPCCTQDFYEQELNDYIENEFHFIPKHLSFLQLLSNNLPAREILMLPMEDYLEIIEELKSLQLIESCPSSVSSYDEDTKSIIDVESVHEVEKVDEFVITDMGRDVCGLPTSLSISVVLLTAHKIFLERVISFDEMLYVLIAGAMVETSFGNPHYFSIPRGDRGKPGILSEAKKEFQCYDDISCLVKMFCLMMEQGGQSKSGLNQWYKTFYINRKFMKSARKLFFQVAGSLQINLPKTLKYTDVIVTRASLNVYQCFAAGFPSNILTYNNKAKIYVDEDTNKLKLNNKSFAVMNHEPSPPERIVALNKIHIRKHMKSFIVADLCLPLVHPDHVTMKDMMGMMRFLLNAKKHGFDLE